MVWVVALGCAHGGPPKVGPPEANAEIEHLRVPVVIESEPELDPPLEADAATGGSAPKTASPRKSASIQRLEGFWSEEFVGRPGCSDIIAIAEQEGHPVISGHDCTDENAYEFSSVHFDGSTLELTLSVPETGVSVRYTLAWGPDGNLEGQAVVHSGSEETPFDVRWTRSP